MMMPLHAGLAAYLRKRGAGAPHRERDGSVVLILDRRFRVLCRPMPGDSLLLESRLGGVPEQPRERTALFLRLLEALGSGLAEHAETIALSRDGLILVQQRHVAAQADVNLFEESLENHVNALGFWRSMIGVL